MDVPKNYQFFEPKEGLPSMFKTGYLLDGTRIYFTVLSLRNCVGTLHSKKILVSYRKLSRARQICTTDLYLKAFKRFSSLAKGSLVLNLLNYFCAVLLLNFRGR